jgi:hypothetical protein
LLLPIAAAVAILMPSAIAVAIALAVGHCCLCHHWSLQSPSPSTITVAVTINNCQELLPWPGKNCHCHLNNLSKECLPYFILFGQWAAHWSKPDDWPGVKQQWPTPALGGERRAANGLWGAAGGSRVEKLPDHGRCCFVVLLGWQPLTDGVCDDVLDVVKGIAGKTMIELTQEEKGIIERYGSDKKMYT